MSEEEKELLARIGQLAGQINRHKNQQAGVRPQASHHPAHHRSEFTSPNLTIISVLTPSGNTYRNASSPYPARSHRVARPAAAHHHRTLQLNAANTPSSRSASSGAETPPGWVSKTDRHRQLINANVYEKETQNRAKAIEQTRQRKISGHRQREKAQFDDFMKHKASASNAQTNPTGRNELSVEGIQFRVVDGGKKLVKVSGAYTPQTVDAQCALPSADAPNALSRTPKSAVIAGVKFYRTKTGNLVANRVVNDQRRSGMVKKINEPCKIFSTTGNFSFRTWSDSNAVSLDLPASPAAPVCRDFGFNGYCSKGAECAERHVFECPDFSNTGRCRVKGCKLPHRERASVLRNRIKAEDEPMEDVSSDDEAGDSDDVDSDEVAEFIDADSDCQDFEAQKDFLSI
ncbi:hypothetical protein Neosp_006554 [[Neocosmospora] mangrovei]